MQRKITVVRPVYVGLTPQMNLTGAIAPPQFPNETHVQQEQRVYQPWQVNDVYANVGDPVQHNRGDLRPSSAPNQAFPTHKRASYQQWAYADATSASAPVGRYDTSNATRQDGHEYERPLHLVLKDPEEEGERLITTPSQLIAAMVGTYFSN